LEAEINNFLVCVILEKVGFPLC